jgi:hypothetical protein
MHTRSWSTNVFENARSEALLQRAASRIMNLALTRAFNRWSHNAMRRRRLSQMSTWLSSRFLKSSLVKSWTKWCVIALRSTCHSAALAKVQMKMRRIMLMRVLKQWAAGRQVALRELEAKHIRSLFLRKMWDKLCIGVCMLHVQARAMILQDEYESPTEVFVDAEEARNVRTDEKWERSGKDDSRILAKLTPSGREIIVNIPHRK